MTMWIFPRSVPMYNHLLWKGRWQKVILQRKGEEISVRGVGKKGRKMKRERKRKNGQTMK